ncbi:MAG: response regulator [Nitrospirae bacterium]|nr:response regulator [Nitrospirota bacterium]
MKKVIINKEILKSLGKRKSFLQRSDIRVFPVKNNEEVLSTHESERADLIITYFDSPGIDGERLCDIIRNNDRLSKVSIILICSDDIDNPDKLLDVRANSLLPSTVDPDTLMEESQKLLNIATRKSLRLNVGVEIHGSTKKSRYSGVVENISSSGILFRSDAKIDEGDIIRCSFILPDKTEVNTDAEIVRVVEGSDGTTESRYFYYGASFTGLDKKTTSAIERFIENYSDK